MARPTLPGGRRGWVAVAGTLWFYHHQGGKLMPRTPNDVRKLAQDAGVQIVDLRFIDLPGIWQHFSIPVEDLGDDLFGDGIGFDGSSIRGYQQIQESDML